MAKRKKVTRRNPPLRRVSRIRKKQKVLTKHAKPRSNRDIKKNHHRAAQPRRPIKQQRRNSRLGKKDRRVKPRTTVRAKQTKARRSQKTVRPVKRESVEKRQQREIDKLRDQLRREREVSLDQQRELRQRRPFGFWGAGRVSTGGAPDQPVRPREPSEYTGEGYDPNRPFDPGIDIPTYEGEEFEDIDWSDFDWDDFEDVIDEDEDSYGDEPK